MVNVTTNLNTWDEQVLLSQEGDPYEGIVLKLGYQQLEKAPLIFGQRWKNEPLGSENPKVQSEENVVVAIQYHNGVITYFLNGKRFASKDTNICEWDPYMGCRMPVADFNENAKLVLGGVAGPGHAYSVWQGTIHSIKIYDRAMMRSELAASVYSPALVQPIVIRKKYVNELSATTARVNAIGILAIDLPNGNTIESKIMAEFDLTRAACLDPGVISRNEVLDLIEEQTGTRYAEGDLIFNAFDDTSVTVSVDTPDGLAHAVLSRHYEYDFGFSDEIILEQLYFAGQEHFQSTVNIENIWVNSLDADQAVLTMKLIDEVGTASDYNVMMGWNPEGGMWHVMGIMPLHIPTEEEFPSGTSINQDRLKLVRLTRAN